MKYVSYFFAIYWAIMFITFVFGTYQPSNIDIGCALFLTAFHFLTSGLEAK